jgi:hypothetical protein
MKTCIGDHCHFLESRNGEGYLRIRPPCTEYSLVVGSHMVPGVRGTRTVPSLRPKAMLLRELSPWNRDPQGV